MERAITRQDRRSHAERMASVRGYHGGVGRGCGVGRGLGGGVAPGTL